MKVTDLTHIIEADMPVFPGTEKPLLEKANTIEKDGFRETLITMFSHTGTHMDAPAHIFEDGATLDSYDAQYLTGRGTVVDCSAKKEGEAILPEDLEPCMREIEAADYVLFYTGWSRFWGEDRYYGRFPCLHMDTVRLLVQKNIRGIGLDVISLDPMEDANLSNHREALASGLLIIENLCGLEEINGKEFTLCLMPLKYRDADGAPARVIAITEG